MSIETEAAEIHHGRKSELIIWDLILSFPCLEKKFWQGPWKEKGLICFDADRLEKASHVWSTGEWLCVRFVLNVWNPGYAKEKGWTFDLVEFIGTADGENRDALIAWLNNPLFP